MLIAVAILMSLALLTGWHRTHQRLTRQQALEQNNKLQKQFLESAFNETTSPTDRNADLSQAEQDRQAALQMSARSPDLMRFTGGIWTSYLPASPLTGLSMGASGEWPEHYRHAGSSVTQTLARDMQPNPLLAVTGAYDMSLVVGIILPLAILILTFDVAAADRETGRWALIQTHCSSTPGLIAARCLVAVVAVTVVINLLLVTSAVAFPIGDVSLAAAAEFAPLGLWVLVYLMFWGSVAFCVASFKLSSAGSGLTLLLCWGTLVLFVPSLVEERLNESSAFPDASELVAMETRIREQVEQQMDSVWADYLQQHPDLKLDDDNPQQEFLLRDIAKEHAARSQIDNELQVHFDQYLNREARVDQSQLLTPTLAWRTVADQYSGTSLRHYIDFAQATATFHDKYVRSFEPMTVAGRELSLADIQSLPKFDGKHIASRRYSYPLSFAGASLICWISVFSFIGWLRLRRSDVATSRGQVSRSS
jgi:type II secretory pathway pseudopilin PulG